MSVNGQLLGYESKWSSGMGTIIPDEYSLPHPQNPIRIVRKIVKRDVDTSMPVNPQNPIIRWKVAGNNSTVLDFRRAKLYVSFQVSVDAPWLARPSSLAWNIVDRFRLEQGGQYIEDRRFFNLQESLVYCTQTHINQQITTGVALYGDGSAARRNLRAAGWKYCLPLPTTALTKGIYPWFAVVNRGNGAYATSSLPDTYLQWEFAKPEAFVEVYGAPAGTPITGLSWLITRMEIEYEELYADGGNERLLKNWVSSALSLSRGTYPRFWYRGFVTNTYPITVNTEQSILIDMKFSSIISIFVTFRYTNQINDPTVYSKFTKYLSKSDFNMIEYQWEVNTCLWPDKPVSLVDPAIVEGYAKYLEAFQMYHARGIQQEVTPITSDAFLNDKYIAVFDGNQHPFSSLCLNPVSTAYSGSNIQFKVKFADPPPVGLEAVIHIYHWRCWNFGAKGDVPIIEN
jgi:hypothetical protein